MEKTIKVIIVRYFSTGEYTLPQRSIYLIYNKFVSAIIDIFFPFQVILPIRTLMMEIA